MNRAKVNGWLQKSNRGKHFIGGMLLGVLLTFFCALGCGGGMEFKDWQWGGEWDWIDFACTVAGGVVGQGIQVLIIYLIVC